jgi:hypothetical protein
MSELSQMDGVDEVDITVAGESRGQVDTRWQLATGSSGEHRCNDVTVSAAVLLLRGAVMPAV